MKKTLLLCLLSGSCLAANYDARSNVILHDFMTPAHQEIDVFVDAFNEFTNDTDKAVEIYAGYSMDVEACKYDSHWFKIKVSPNSHWEDHYRVRARCSLPRGNFQIKGYAKVLLDGKTLSRFEGNSVLRVM